MTAADNLRKKMQNIRLRTQPESLAGEPLASSYTPADPHHLPEEPIPMVPADDGQLPVIGTVEPIDQILDLVDTVPPATSSGDTVTPDASEHQSPQPVKPVVQKSPVSKRLIMAAGVAMVVLGVGMYFFDKWKEEQPAPQAGLQKRAAVFSPSTSHKSALRPIGTVPDLISPEDKIGLTTNQPAAKLVVQGNEPKPFRKNTELPNEKPVSAPVAVNRKRGKHHQRSVAHTVSAKDIVSKTVTHIEEKKITSAPAQIEHVMPEQLSTGTLLQELKDARRL